MKKEQKRKEKAIKRIWQIYKKELEIIKKNE